MLLLTSLGLSLCLSCLAAANLSFIRITYLYRAALLGRSQVARMLQASWGRSGELQQEQNSPNLGTASYWRPVYKDVTPIARNGRGGGRPYGFESVE